MEMSRSRVRCQGLRRKQSGLKGESEERMVRVSNWGWDKEHRGPYQRGSRTLRRAKFQRDPSLPFLLLCIDKPLSIYMKTRG